MNKPKKKVRDIKNPLRIILDFGSTFKFIPFSLVLKRENVLVRPIFRYSVFLRLQHYMHHLQYLLKRYRYAFIIQHCQKKNSTKFRTLL